MNEDAAERRAAEDRAELLERRVRQLWSVCRRFSVRTGECDDGSAASEEMPLPDFDLADTDHFGDAFGRPRPADDANVDGWAKCVYCGRPKREHGQAACDGR